MSSEQTRVVYAVFDKLGHLLGASRDKDCATHMAETGCVNRPQVVVPMIESRPTDPRPEDVQRLVEAARKVNDSRNDDASGDLPHSSVIDLNAAIELADALSPFTTPAANAGEGKVRCWRGVRGPCWHDGTDRIRLRSDGETEWVWPDGRTERCERCFDVSYCEARAADGAFVECDDEPYRTTPTPPAAARESEESVAERIVVLCGGAATRGEYAKQVEAILTARDTASDAEIERLRNERDDLEHARKLQYDEIGRLNARITQLEQDHAAACAKVDPELLETAREFYIEKIRNGSSGAPIMDECIDAAKMLHAALAKGGE